MFQPELPRYTKNPHLDHTNCLATLAKSLFLIDNAGPEPSVAHIGILVRFSTSLLQSLELFDVVV